MSDQNFGTLFEGEELSQEFIDKATLVFESAVTEKANTKVAEVVQEMQEAFDKELETIHEELVEKIDAALNYFVEGWLQENKVAIEQGIRTEIVENFISGLKDLFTESYIEVPEEKVEYVSEMETKFAEMEDKLNEQVQKNIDLNAKIAKMVKESIFTDVAAGLAETEIEKFEGLAESVEFSSEADYKGKLETLRENYFPKSQKTEKEPETTQINENVVPEIDQIAKYIAEKYADI